MTRPIRTKNIRACRLGSFDLAGRRALADAAGIKRLVIFHPIPAMTTDHGSDCEAAEKAGPHHRRARRADAAAVMALKDGRIREVRHDRSPDLAPPGPRLPTILGLANRGLHPLRYAETMAPAAVAISIRR